MVGIHVPIWDVRSSYLSKDIYVQCSPIKDITGLGVTNHFVETMEASGIFSLGYTNCINNKTWLTVQWVGNIFN